MKKYRATAKGKALLDHRAIGKHDYEISTIVRFLVRHPNSTREEIVAGKAHDWGGRGTVRSILALALRGKYVTYRIMRR